MLTYNFLSWLSCISYIPHFLNSSFHPLFPWGPLLRTCFGFEKPHSSKYFNWVAGATPYFSSLTFEYICISNTSSTISQFLISNLVRLWSLVCILDGNVFVRLSQDSTVASTNLRKKSAVVPSSYCHIMSNSSMPLIFKLFKLGNATCMWSIDSSSLRS